jgi:cyclase
MKRALWSAITLFLTALVLAAADKSFEVKPVADGVYAAIAPGAFNGRCNSAIVVSDDGVLVVDTDLTPSQARDMIAAVRKITSKPIKYVLNTHSHGDHSQGNQAYREAFPNAEFVASAGTRRDLETRGLARVKAAAFAAEQAVDKLKADLGAATESKKRELQEKLRQAEANLAELKTLQLVLPTLTFDRELTLNHASRTVEFICVGPAHSTSDVVAYLPKEKVIITGDLLHGWTPYMGDSSPYDWIRALDQVEKLDFDTIIPGHGDVFHGKDQFELWKQYLRDLMSETTDAWVQGASLEEAKKQVAATLQAKYRGNFPDTFALEVQGNIAKAYRFVSGSQD